jgi:hypothetical protein
MALDLSLFRLQLVDRIEVESAPEVLSWEADLKVQLMAFAKY